MTSEPSRLLSIGAFDGGGSWGLTAALMAQEFETRAGGVFHQHFDVLGGVSVGIMNAASLWPLRKTEQPLVSVENLVQIYENKLGPAFTFSKGRLARVFQLGGALGPKYSLDGLKEVLLEYFGELTLADYADGLHVHVFDVATGRFAVLSSEQAHANQDLNFPILDLMMAGASVPVMFGQKPTQSVSGIKREFTDGGLANQSPVMRLHSQFNGRTGALTCFATGKRSKTSDLSFLSGHVISAMLAVIKLMFNASVCEAKDYVEAFLGTKFVNLDIDAPNTAFRKGEINGTLTPFPVVARISKELIVPQNEGRIAQAIANIRAVRGQQAEPPAPQQLHLA